VGVLARASNKVQIGAAWKSRTVINTSGRASGDASVLFAALGANAPSQFTYAAQVQNVLPQSVLANIAWQANPRWLFAIQTDWTNWGDAFVSLPVTLTNGTNATINSLVGSTTLLDSVPLHWKDHYVESDFDGIRVPARALTLGSLLQLPPNRPSERATELASFRRI
jgi:long-subunit fatty acid transport protein